ncbi:MAG: hypothetical protein SPJ39_06865 [Prevotella sp.]|nr:hypothetical protein [Prevotella sp.]
MLDETYWRTQMRSHTPIGLAVAFYLIFIVIIFYLLSSLAIISHQHCSIYHQQWLSLNQQMASLSQHCSSLLSGSIAHGFSLIFAKVTFLIYRTSHYVQKNTKKVIFLKVKEFLKVKRLKRLTPY